MLKIRAHLSTEAGKGYEKRARRLPPFMLANEYSRSIVRDLGHGLLPLANQYYTVCEGDTFVSIAENVMHDRRYAVELADANHWIAEGAPTPGQMLRIPQYVPSYNGVQTHSSFNTFRAIIIGNVYPYLDLPQQDDDDDFLTTLVSVVIITVIAIAAPYLLGATTYLEIGAAAALGSAVGQGVCMAIGIQHRFDFLQVIETGLTAGMMQGMGLLNNVTQITMERLIKYGMINATMQLIDMAAGRTNRFDPNALLASMAAGLARDTISMKISLPDIKPEIPQAAANVIASSTIRSVILNQPLRFDRVMAEAIGSSIGTGIGVSVTTAIQHYRETLSDYQSLAKEQQKQQEQQQRQTPHDRNYHQLPGVRQQQASRYRNVDQEYLDDDTTALPGKTASTKGRTGHRSAVATSRNATHRQPIRENIPELDWKPDYSLPIPADADRRFTQWQQQAEQNNAARKWAEQTRHMEHWSKGKLYDVKTDTLYEPKQGGGYHVIHDFDNPMATLFGPIGPELGLAARGIASTVSQAGKLVSRLQIFGRKESLDAYSQFSRQYTMLTKNVGYNISPENWFKEFSFIGRNGTFITDYRAIGEVLGPVRANIKYELGLFSKNDIVSYYKAHKLEKYLGLEPDSLKQGFRFTRISKITDMNPRSPLEGNRFFKSPGAGLPGGGPEIVVNRIATKNWPPVGGVNE